MTWTVTDVPGFWAVMTPFIEKALAIKPGGTAGALRHALSSASIRRVSPMWE